MNHPTQEEWMSYLYGELPGEKHADLNAHLQVCPECKRSVEAWKGAMQELNSWRFPERTARFKLTTPLLKWGMAAMLVLSFGFGWLSARSSPGLKQIQVALLPALRDELRKELSGDLRAAFSATSVALTNDFRRELRSEFDQWAASTIATSRVQTEQLVANLVESNNSLRQEDRQAALALVQKLEQQHRVDYGTLLKKLETVALVAEERLQRTQNQIGQLVAYTQTDYSSNK